MDETSKTFINHFAWENIRLYINTFDQSCFHYQVIYLGNVVPIPMENALLVDKPNRILHFDYTYIGPSDKRLNYILLLKDGFSSYTCLFPFECCDADSPVESLTEWFTAFGVVLEWVSDRGFHFMNNLLKVLNEILKG